MTVARARAAPATGLSGAISGWWNAGSPEPGRVQKKKDETYTLRLQTYDRFNPVLKLDKNVFIITFDTFDSS